MICRQKQDSADTDSALVEDTSGLAVKFERSEHNRKPRVVLYEILRIQSEVSNLHLIIFITITCLPPIS